MTTTVTPDLKSNIENVLDHGAKGDGSSGAGTDDTAAFQSAIDSIAVSEGGRGGVVLIPPLQYIIGQIELKDGVALQGHTGVGGTRGTVLSMLAGSNKSMIISDKSFAGNAFQHYTRIEDIALRDDNSNTAGSGIEWSNRCGEAWTARRLTFNGLPDNGILLKRGGTAISIDDLHAFECGTSGAGYALNVEAESTDVWQGCWVRRISGDGNKDGLMKFKNFNSADAIISVDGVKSENTLTTHQQTVIHLDANRAVVTIKNIVSASLAAQRSIIKITDESGGSRTPRIMLQTIRARDNTSFLIDDVIKSTTIAKPTGNGAGVHLLIYSGEEKFRIDSRDDLFMPNLPTSDPSSTGKLWNDSGTLKVSA